MTFMAPPPRIATFSIVGRDAAADEWGIGVASKFLAVGAVVPWAQAGVGALATQASAGAGYGTRGLALLKQGRAATEVVDLLVAKDEGRDHRQVGVVDAQGGSAAWTGPLCLRWAGHRTGVNFACQGNILAGEAVIEAMADSFGRSTGSSPRSRPARAREATAVDNNRRPCSSCEHGAATAESPTGRSISGLTTTPRPSRS